MAHQKLISACISTVLGLSWLFSLPVSAQTGQTSARQETGDREIENFSQVGEVAQQPETQQPSNTTREMKTFLDWCQNRDSLTPEAKYTVEVILERIRVQDCQKAHQKLLNQTSLDLSNHFTEKIEDLNPLSSLIYLEDLDLSYNNIGELTPLSSLVNLRVLRLHRATKHSSRNVVRHGKTSLNLTPIASLNNLQILDLSYNIITDLTPLASLINLQALLIIGIGSPDSGSNIDLTPISQLTNLQELQIDRNPNIENLSSLSSLINLKLLGLNETGIKDISFLSSLVNLEELYLINNEIKDITPLSNLINLKKTYLFHNNEIEDITPLSDLLKLQVLFLGNNQIKDITPLSSLTNLQELWLWTNQITDVTPLSHLQDLLVLDLSGNKIQDISALSSLTNLQFLHLYNNRNLETRCPLPRKTICVWEF